MPFESEDSEAQARPSPWDWLASQELGILCGLSTVALLAVGSIVLAATRDGASAAVGMDDVRVFFEQPSPVHFWFYLLFALLPLYALNTLLATWKSVSQKWRYGVRAPRLYAASLLHIAFLFGLLAHLVGGFASKEMGQVMVGPAWTELGNGRQARVTDLEVSRHPDGSTRQVWAKLDVRSKKGQLESSFVHYNGPLSTGFGSELFLLTRSGRLPVAKLARGNTHCVAAQEASCLLGDVEVAVLYLEVPPGGQGAMARVQVADGSLRRRRTFWLFQGRPEPLDDDTTLTLAAIEQRPAVLLRHRRAPGNPWALLASVLLVAGLLLMWRRFLPNRSA
jgi:hypothetical protein